MTVAEIVRIVVGRMEAARADYQIVGALAYLLYGPARFTQDVDLVVSMPTAQLNEILAGLPAEFAVEPQARMELFTGTMRWVVGVSGTELKLELFLLGSDPHHLEEFSRRRRQWLPGAEVEAWVATPEDLIIQKLRWSRLKDLEDIRGILSVQGDSLDRAYIEGWCDRHGTRERLEEMRRSIPSGI